MQFFNLNIEKLLAIFSACGIKHLDRLDNLYFAIAPAASKNASWTPLAIDGQHDLVVMPIKFLRSWDKLRANEAAQYSGQEQYEVDRRKQFGAQLVYSLFRAIANVRDSYYDSDKFTALVKAIGATFARNPATGEISMQLPAQVLDAVPVTPEYTKRAGKKASTATYTCLACEFTLRGKAGLHVTCGTCACELISPPTGSDKPSLSDRPANQLTA